MGASGMGQAIAELLAGRGAQVTVLDREGCQSQKQVCRRSRCCVIFLRSLRHRLHRH